MHTASRCTRKFAFGNFGQLINALRPRCGANGVPFINKNPRNIHSWHGHQKNSHFSQLSPLSSLPSSPVTSFVEIVLFPSLSLFSSSLFCFQRIGFFLRGSLLATRTIRQNRYYLLSAHGIIFAPNSECFKICSSVVQYLSTMRNSVVSRLRFESREISQQILIW